VEKLKNRKSISVKVNRMMKEDEIKNEEVVIEKDCENIN
jgi:hypothetical protein